MPPVSPAQVQQQFLFGGVMNLINPCAKQVLFQLAAQAT
jgi:hypothetical protein